MTQQTQLAALNKRRLEVEQENKFQEGLLDENRLKTSELDILKEMGFGLRELRIVRNLANEMAAGEGKYAERGLVVREFISDIENHHYDYLRLRNKVSELKAQESNFLSILGASSRLGNAVSSFLSRKPTGNDIKDLIEMIEVLPISELAEADSGSVKDREKTGQSTTQPDTKNPAKGKQERIRSNSHVQKDEVYIPSPFSEFAQQSFIPSFDEADKRPLPKTKHRQTKEVGLEGKTKIVW